MRLFKILFFTVVVLMISSCSDDKEVIVSSIESIQSCRASFIPNVEFSYSSTYFENGDVFVSCSLTDFQLNRSVSTDKFYSWQSSSSEAQRLECVNLHDLSSTQGGEFVFDVVNNIPGMTFVNTIPPAFSQTYQFLSTDCTSEFF